MKKLCATNKIAFCFFFFFFAIARFVFILVVFLMLCWYCFSLVLYCNQYMLVCMLFVILNQKSFYIALCCLTACACLIGCTQKKKKSVSRTDLYATQMVLSHLCGLNFFYNLCIEILLNFHL